MFKKRYMKEFLRGKIMQKLLDIICPTCIIIVDGGISHDFGLERPML